MKEQNLKLKEDAVHGTIKFPLAVYRHEGEGEFVVKLHWHDETEIIFLKRGRFRVDMNMHTYALTAPALLFVGSGDIHAILGEDGCLESAVVFDMKMLSFEHYDEVQYQILRPLLDKTMQFPALLTPKEAAWEELIMLYGQVLAGAEEKTPAAGMRVKANLLQMLACLYEQHYFNNMEQADLHASRRIEDAKKVLGYIQNHYHERITNQDMAGILQMNEQYFCRYFKKIMGKTPTDYINEVRIEKAAEYLRRTDRKIVDIAMDCGYENMGYFIKRFRRQKGSSPSKYRERVSGEYRGD